MNYDSGEMVCLGDIVEVDLWDGRHQARVVMIGETHQYAVIDSETAAWASESGHVGSKNILVEWSTGNPFEHDDKNFSPVANTLSLTLAGVVLKQRAEHT